MTRTPPDMETAMSDPMLAEMITRGDRIIELQRKLAELKRGYDKLARPLSALGDPVVVAEALPELVEAGAELADKAQILRINCGGYRPERPTEKNRFMEDMKALLDAEDQWSDALAKMMGAANA